MKTSSPPSAGPGRTVARFLGYGGAALLVSAALAVLVFQAFGGKHRSDASAAGTGTTSPSSGASGGTSGTVPSGPVQQQTRGGSPYPSKSGAPGTGSQPGDQGAPMPGTGGGVGPQFCPAGTADYRAAGTNGIDVAVSVGAAGVVKADVTVAGHGDLSDQATVHRAGTQKFHFTVAPALVRRVKITTMSVGVDMQSCYARPA
ncbi:hypothetical protein [Actinomadura rupiterrae]|uniref:hypothetical protein n=1 Tax=Actinomadura rupiterrae TaxID=559627 RepID=UPI0020A3A996|nr:hypothetical protein [Actinomadura rupiterrae]MCP2340878.1 hypothetical protein [Actinomadura rupiterrae]